MRDNNFIYDAATKTYRVSDDYSYRATRVSTGGSFGLTTWIFIVTTVASVVLSLMQ